MDSASLALILYGLVAAVAISFARSERSRALVLLAFSAAFLALLGATVANVVPMAAFLAFGYVGMQCAGRTKALLPPLVVATVLAFTYLKKYTFFPPDVLIARPYFTLGLSYVFFRVLHLLIESREMAPGDRPGPLHFLGYTLNFTTLVSGPIQRYADFKANLAETPETRLDAPTVAAQLARIAVGYFKVNVVASVLDIARDESSLSLAQAGGASSHFAAALTLVAVYPFFLYANFSGYIDIVIALARLMRIRLPENFDHPFSASSFLDFWNRWHITLSQWLKFYVYNPLLMALMRRVSSVAVQPYLGVFCFFVTFFLIGVWHGRTSEFAVFGLLQGGGVAVNKLWQIFLGKRLGKKGYKTLSADGRYVALGRGLTFSWFAFTMFWFWADWHEIGTIFASLSAPAWIAAWLVVIAASALGLTLWTHARERLSAGGGAWRASASASLLGAAIFASFFYCALLDQPAPGIIYKAF